MAEAFGLYRLIGESPAAKRFYEDLPDHVREQIGRQAERINDEQTLFASTEELLNEK